jgi:signal transduction histidine kinase
MQNAEQKEPIELLLVISGNQEFHEQVQRELARRHDHLCVTVASSFEGARRAIEARSPAVILLDECALSGGDVTQQQRKPTLWAAATSLAECGPLVVVGSAEHQTELAALLAGGDVDFVVCSESSLAAAVGLVERRLRHQRLRTRRDAASRQEQENPMESRQETRDFGEVLRHELNNPLTGILGNAELLLVELRRRNIELPQQTVLRLETIATLAVRMRETVRRLSEDWETQTEHGSEELETHPS